MKQHRKKYKIYPINFPINWQILHCKFPHSDHKYWHLIFSPNNFEPILLLSYHYIQNITESKIAFETTQTNHGRWNFYFKTNIAKFMNEYFCHRFLMPLNQSISFRSSGFLAIFTSPSHIQKSTMSEFHNEIWICDL